MAEEYPRDLAELEADFGTEEACRAYLTRLRWPTGFRCSRCGSGKAWPVRDLWQCAGCGCQTSVSAGTIFQDTRTPLPVWFRAMWWVTTQKNGASALGLQRVLGLKSYETAWTWLHKLRRAMVRPGRDLLAGRIEVDECYVGGLEEGLLGRLNLQKALVIVAAQEDGPGIGRIRMRQIIDASAESLVPFLPARAASCGSRARSPGSDSSPRSQAEKETTICRGYLSQADTHFHGIANLPLMRPRFSRHASQESGWGKFGHIPDYLDEKHADLQAGECAEMVAFQHRIGREPDCTI